MSVPLEWLAGCLRAAGRAVAYFVDNEKIELVSVVGAWLVGGHAHSSKGAAWINRWLAPGPPHFLRGWLQPLLPRLDSIDPRGTTRAE